MSDTLMLNSTQAKTNFEKDTSGESDAKSYSISELGKLSEEIKYWQEKNSLIYQQVKDTNPNYMIELFRPNIPVCAREVQVQTIKKNMINQLDTLLAEQLKLFREINKQHLVNQQTEFLQNRLQQNPYCFFRSVWTRPNLQDDSSQHRIERLNKSVAFIKAHVQNLIKKEQLQQNTQEMNKLLRQSIHYIKLKQQYEQIQMQVEFYRSVHQQIKIKLQLEIQNGKKFQQECDTLIHKITIMKDKERNLEAKTLRLQIKVQQLEQANYQLQKKSKLNKLNQKYTFINPVQNFQIQIHKKSTFDQQEVLVTHSLSSILDFLADAAKENIQALIRDTGSTELQTSNILGAIGCMQFNSSNDQYLKKKFNQINSGQLGSPKQFGSPRQLGYPRQLGSPRQIKNLKTMAQTIDVQLKKKRLQRQPSTDLLHMGKYERGVSPRDLINQIQNNL